MSRNGSGVYNLPAGNPVVSGTTISSNWANTTLSDIASALTASIATDGQTPMSGTLNMTDNLITNVATPVSDQDAVNKLYLDTAVATIEGEIATINAVISGSIQMWPTATAPTGYLSCVGTAVSRTTYAALFAVIGTTFGVGDGSTTFNLPNYTNKFPYGATVGSTGGSADAIVVSHSHTATSSSSVSDPGHKHGVNVDNDMGGQAGSGDRPSVNPNHVNNSFIVNATTGISVSTSTSVASTGSSGTGANIPPYLGINFIIKT